MKILNILFPFIDHLYIFQLLEYEPTQFIKWFFKNPFRRNLQKKHQLTLTKKIILLLILVSLLIVSSAIYFNFLFLRGLDFPVIIFFILYFQLFSPFFILVAVAILNPFESYSKNKIINQAKIKLSTLPNLKIVAITGSFGKTSTKDILYTLLWKKYRAVKTPKSYNNPLSIAQTIIELVKEETEILIVEVGAYKKGEIANVVSWLKPKIGIITGIAPQHLEKFGSIENVALAKFELIEGLKNDGIAILNGENNLIKNLSKKMKNKIIFFGNVKDQTHATNIKVTPKGTSFTLQTKNKSLEMNIPLIGEHHAKNFIAAAQAALELGLTFEEIKQRSSKLLPTPHRLEIKTQGEITIIDNSYNTNTDSAKISFKLLKDYPGNQKIIITPGLIELGEKSSEENQNFAKEASQVSDEIIIVGDNAKQDLLKGLELTRLKQEKIHTVKSLQSGMALLSKISKKGAVVLIENDLPDQYF